MSTTVGMTIETTTPRIVIESYYVQTIPDLPETMDREAEDYDPERPSLREPCSIRPPREYVKIQVGGGPDSITIGRHDVGLLIKLLHSHE